MRKPISQFVLVSYGAIGDFLMLLSLSDELHQKNSSAKAVVCTPRSVTLFRELASNYPWVQIVEVSRRHPLRALSRLAPVALRRTGVLLLPTFGSFPVELSLLGRMLTLRFGSMFVGFKTKQNISFFSRALEFNTEEPIYNNLLRAASEFGYVLPNTEPAYHFTAAPGLFERIKVKSPYIVVHPFAANRKRSLPLRRWVPLLSQIRSIYPDYELVITGATSDIAGASLIAKQSGSRSLAGQLSMTELATLIRNSATFVGVDTGVTHLACMLRTPSVVIGNRSNPTWLPYYNDRAVVLFNITRCTCRGDKTGNCEIVENNQVYYRCMFDITDESILSALDRVIPHR